MDQETSSAWPGSIDEVTFAIFSMAFYMLMDILLASFLMAYRQYVPTDSGQVMGAVILSWGVGWSGAFLRMNRACSMRPCMSRDAADNEALKSLAMGALLQLPIPAMFFALAPASGLLAALAV